MFRAGDKQPDLGESIKNDNPLLVLRHDLHREGSLELIVALTGKGLIEYIKINSLKSLPEIRQSPEKLL